MNDVPAVDVLMTILLYTRGQYTVEQVEEMYLLLLSYEEVEAELAEEANKPRPTVAPFTGGNKDAEQEQETT